MAPAVSRADFAQELLRSVASAAAGALAQAAQDATGPNSATPGYGAEQQRRFGEALANAPREDDVRTAPKAHAHMQCVPATLYTLPYRGNRLPYARYIEKLDSEGRFGLMSGISVATMREMLLEQGLPTRVLPFAQDPQGVLRELSFALDAGMAVFLNVDVEAVLEAQSGTRGDRGRLMDFWGHSHVVRVTALERDTKGRVLKYGLYDVNYPSGGAVTHDKMLEVVQSQKLSFPAAAILTTKPVHPPMPLH